MATAARTSFGKRTPIVERRVMYGAASLSSMNAKLRVSPFKRTMLVLGYLTLAVVIFGGAAFGYIAYQGTRLDAESKGFADRMVSEIASTWKASSVLDHASPELRASVDPDKMQVTLQQLSQLGHLVRSDGAEGESGMSYVAGKSTSITAHYSSEVHCQFGDITVGLMLVKLGDQWLIRHISLTPRFSGSRSHAT
jgi:hypothetical protein